LPPVLMTANILLTLVFVRDTQAEGPDRLLAI
jgi:hypothetical protein